MGYSAQVDMLAPDRHVVVLNVRRMSQHSGVSPAMSGSLGTGVEQKGGLASESWGKAVGMDAKE